MKKNVGGVERAIRAVVGLVILGVGFYYKSPWGLVGLVPMFTAAVGFCPAYVPFGISTCKDASCCAHDGAHKH